MSLLGLVKFATSHARLQSLSEHLARGTTEQLLYGVSGSVESLLLSCVRHETGRPVLVVTDSLVVAEKIAQDIESWLGGTVHVFPPLEVLPFEIVAQSSEMASFRISVLNSLSSDKAPIVVAPIAALLRKLPPPEQFNATVTQIAAGEIMDSDLLLKNLVLGGYERCDMVEGRGQFSRRGGIIDIFPPNRDYPVRLELFDDELDSIREFDPVTQRSLGEHPALRIPPAHELVSRNQGFDEGLDKIRQSLDSTLRRLETQGHRVLASKLRDKISEHLEKMATSRSLEGLDQYAPYFYPRMCSLLDYMPQDTVIFVDEFVRLREAALHSEDTYGEMYRSLVDQGSLLPGQHTIYFVLDDLVASWKQRQVIYSSLLLRRLQHADPENVVSVVSRPAQVFHGQWPVFVQEMQRYKKLRYRIVLAASSEERAKRLSAQLRDDGIENSLVAQIPREPEPGVVNIASTLINNGFEVPELGLIVITDAEIYGRPRRPRKTRAFKQAGRLQDYRELRAGDYVVHVNHGIGKYMGIRTLEIEGAHRDYLLIQYHGADALYVPTDQIHVIQKYVGQEGHEPKISRLGGTEWARAKHRVKESVREMARELLRLYALRESVKGFAFGKDTPWQHQFEDSFQYEETPDQLEATKEIKNDMEKQRPMDRLLCGDVGYGKTEVAIRAAFKAVMDGKQVAVLVPTTILAQQHYNTLKERFDGFPVRIAMTSRFLSQKEHNEVLKATSQGVVDILIGTHRMLGEGVRFKDLGLLIVDEEHRFGVGHKEEIKQLRANVDVLTLTATPIPRTLSMALSGLRDMSLIETPPEDRFPVQTYVLEASDELIRDAIMREVSRGGQVFYVHNRVQSIDRVAEHVSSLVPAVRIAVGHGQMKEDKLEQVMLDFISGEYDVLVCTTIIESGLDIPNANTLIVDDADHLGLAQLYQLRGRVGRSNRLAYAYFTYKREKVLTETSEKRLDAIREFTELGSGFKLAMRDLEIRGAGNVLGPEQHGFIMSVGYDLYVQLLEEAIRELRQEAVPKEKPQVSIDIPVDVYVPDDFVPSQRQKIELYKKVAAIESLEDADEVAEDILDRYGHPPVPVQNLLAVARVKVRARELGIVAISQQKERVGFKFGDVNKRRLEAIAGYLRGLRGRFTVSTTRTPSVIMRLESTKSALSATEQLLKKLCNLAL